MDPVRDDCNCPDLASLARRDYFDHDGYKTHDWRGRLINYDLGEIYGRGENMSAFDEKHVQAAIDRVPRLSSKELRDLRARAEKANIDTLVSACDAELAARPMEWSGEDAFAFEIMAEQVKDMSLTDAIRHAFTTARRADPDEIRCLRWIAANSGASFQAALKAYGKGDLSLVIGHLVYNRYGCFKRFFQAGEDQSSVLISKDRSGEGVRYTLRPEALDVFRGLGLIE